MNYNRLQVGGFLTRNPELAYTPGGVAVCKFSVAANHKYKDQEEVLFMPCTAFGKTGELINEHFKKGNPIFTEGRLKEEKWADKETGAPRSKVVLIVDRFTFVGGKREESARSPDNDDVPF